MITFITTSFGQNSEDYNEAHFRNKINLEFEKVYSECKHFENGISKLNEKIEFWSVCDLKNGKQIIKIHSHKEVTYYEEIYYSKNGKLMYAKETENYIPKNSFTQMQWNCQFYVKNDSLYTIISLGHGKTENDEWEPEIILEMYKKRKKELEILKKNNG